MTPTKSPVLFAWLLTLTALACLAPNLALADDHEDRVVNEFEQTGYYECAEQFPFVPPARTGEFSEFYNEAMLFDAPPGHSVRDVIATPGSTVTVEGKFAYGTISKDLEEERVRAFLHTCDGWQEVGSDVTNDDGRSYIDIDTSVLPGPGHYKVAHMVEGDGTLAFSNLDVLPEGTKVAIFDIDGTLTDSDHELIEQIMDAEDWPLVADSAARLTNHWADMGYHIIYLTGRPYWMMEQTRIWFEREGMPHGTLRMTESFGDSMPGVENIGTYKVGVLEEVLDLGMDIQRAHGNSSTDIYAYLKVGIDPTDIYIRGTNGGRDGTHPIARSWGEHCDTLNTLARAQQPWEPVETMTGRLEKALPILGGVDGSGEPSDVVAARDRRRAEPATVEPPVELEKDPAARLDPK